ncbi:MAG: hypothetical protein WCN98_15565, partial [Verrucomicrobiaceae bacterium]
PLAVFVVPYELCPSAFCPFFGSRISLGRRNILCIERIFPRHLLANVGRANREASARYEQHTCKNIYE